MFLYITYINIIYSEFMDLSVYERRITQNIAHNRLLHGAAAVLLTVRESDIVRIYSLSQVIIFKISASLSLGAWQLIVHG